MSDDDQPDDEIDAVEPDPDLEDTMRLGLREIANDAPRGENVWDTTTSMIAIEVENTDEHAVPVPLPPAVIPPTARVDAAGPVPETVPDNVSRRIVIASVAVLALVVIVIAVLLATRG